jgi:quinohemoprotein ethanol dehydrogenase
VRLLRHGWVISVGLSLAASVASAASPQPGPVAVDTALLSDESAADQWPSYGRTYSENHYSPLAEISTKSISRLKLAWSHDLQVNQRVDSQPLEANGVVYVAVGLSIVQALDARTGQLLWRYDPKVADVAGIKLRPSWGIRGLALWRDLVIVATQDGRLVALQSTTGKPAWSVQTLDKEDETSITGAPRVFNDKVVIGFAGGDRDKVRGALNCFDARTGKFLWRFYTVPGDPAKGFENEAMRMAAKTWSGQWWKLGGGGTVWNAMTFDPELNRLYIGTGNGSPWNWKIRNPGGGDALFVASIIALDANTGAYLWHFQTHPNEAWDYDATMDLVLADLNIAGAPRKVLLQAPKNGYFYVLDRKTGKLISDERIGEVSWGKVDPKTGRPVEGRNARYQEGPALVWPGTYGTHNWEPMSYNPVKAVVYIPTIHQADSYDATGVDPKTWKPTLHGWNAGLGSSGSGASTIVVPVDQFSSALLAWDPVHQAKVWQVPTPGVVNGGVMSTGGGLVFQGHVDGTFNAYDAATGAKVWSFPAGVSVLGAPISYRIAGVQYVTVLSGPISGSAAATLPQSVKAGWRYRDSPRRVLTFALDGKATLPPSPSPAPETPLQSNQLRPEPAKVAAGGTLFGIHCMTCHGVGAVAGGAAPDLRASPVVLDSGAFKQIVHDGALLTRGMPQFSELSDTDLTDLRHYLRAQAQPEAQH